MDTSSGTLGGMIEVTGAHLENCWGRADKFYRVYAATTGHVACSYGARGKPGRAAATVTSTAAAVTGSDATSLFYEHVDHRKTRGYADVVSLRFFVPPAVLPPDGADTSALDVAFDAQWRAQEASAIQQLQSVDPASGDRAVATLPLWQGPRGPGGHREGRPWGAALAQALTGCPAGYIETSRTTVTTMPARAGDVVQRMYPDADVVILPAGVDEPSLVVLLPQLLSTGGFATLANAVDAALPALT